MDITHGVCFIQLSAKTKKSILKVYKYRGDFKRDLKALKSNYFWAPDFNNLNDPCETTITSETLKSQSKILLPFFGKQNTKQFNEVFDLVEGVLAHSKRMGIYSLSKTFNDELLWAHYANSHKGFCIEYDLEALVKTYKSNNIYNFLVDYKKYPPSVDLNDVIKAAKSNSLIKKMVGVKSQRWKYEEEIRVITDDFGEHVYDFDAVKSIYFGLRMPDEEKKELIKTLRGRGINYFQIERIPNSYKFERKPISDLYGSKVTYLSEFSISKSRHDIVNYRIIEKDYSKIYRKGTITIELDNKLHFEEIQTLCKIIKSDIFRIAKRVFISFRLKDSNDNDAHWSIAEFENDDLKVSIHGLTIEEENILIDGLQKEQRETLGMWIDNTPYVCASNVLLESDEGVFLETNYRDGSKSSKKLKSVQLEDKVRYDDYEPNNHGEYLVLDKDGVLNYHSEDGIFRTLKPFIKK